MNTLSLQVQRHELKFYISRSDYVHAAFLLRQLMQQDDHQRNKQGYFIRSLYFDDVAESAVEEKLDGIERRDKYRIRLYDPKQEWVKLERKRKVNNFVSKTSVSISKTEALSLIAGEYDFLKDRRTPDAVSLYFDFKRKYFRPVVVIDYIRDVYKLDYNEIRITFDQYIRSNTENFMIFDEHLPTIPLQREDVVIMEVKFNTCLPSWFGDFFRFESAIQVAISKYCYGRMGTREFYFSEPTL